MKWDLFHGLLASYWCIILATVDTPFFGEIGGQGEENHGVLSKLWCTYRSGTLFPLLHTTAGDYGIIALTVSAIRNFRKHWCHFKGKQLSPEELFRCVRPLDRNRSIVPPSSGSTVLTAAVTGLSGQGTSVEPIGHGFANYKGQGEIQSNARDS